MLHKLQLSVLERLNEREYPYTLVVLCKHTCRINSDMWNVQFFFFSDIFETRSCCAAQAGLKLMIILIHNFSLWSSIVGEVKALGPKAANLIHPYS